MKIKNGRSPERQDYYVLDLTNKVVEDAICWVNKNKGAWKSVVDLALEKARKTTGKISISHLIERMRGDYEHVSVANAFKPVLARLLEYSYPDILEGRFSKCKTQTEQIVATDYEREITKKEIVKLLPQVKTKSRNNKYGRQPFVFGSDVITDYVEV